MLLILAAMLTTCSSLIAGTYSGGSGTQEVPYLIASTDDLIELSKTSGDWSAHFIQTVNIAFDANEQNVDWDGDGSASWDTEDQKGFSPIAFDSDNNGSPKFTGVYNGQDHTISYLYINRPSEANVGLFSHIGEEGSGDGVVISNLGLINVTVTGARGTGTLAGRVTGDQNTSITRCYAISGTVCGDGATGGLVGTNNSYVESPSNRDNHPIISQCYANINVSFSGSGGADKFGGLAGCNQKGKIYNSYARGNVSTSGTARVGGLAGCILTRGYIEYSHSSGAVTGGSNVGGFVGSGGTGGSNGDAVSCFWDTQTSGQSTSSPTTGCTGKTTAEMKTHTTFTGAGWDFEIETINGTNNYWDMDYSGTINNGYPYLSWQDGGNVSLPVELTSFSARYKNRSIVLEWVTESEVDNLGFILERSENNIGWIQIASYQTHDALEGQCNTSSRTEYIFIDCYVESGKEYAYRLSDVSTQGEITQHAPLFIMVDALPESTVMDNAYPNPFNPKTYIAYYLTGSAEVNILVFDMLGRKVRTLFTGKQPAGSYHIYWNGSDENGLKAPSGNYIIHMQTQNTTQVQKVTLMK